MPRFMTIPNRSEPRDGAEWQGVTINIGLRISSYARPLRLRLRFLAQSAYAVANKQSDGQAGSPFTDALISRRCWSIGAHSINSIKPSSDDRRAFSRAEKANAS